MIDEDSAGFVEAFTAAVRPEEPRGRPGWLMLMFAAAVVFAVTLGSLLNGAFGAGGSGTSGSGGGQTAAGALTAGAGSESGSSLDAAAPLAPPNAPTWTAIAGPTCAGAGTSFTETGFHAGGTDPAADWATSASGGYSGGGCAGGFVSLPLSGRADAFDSDRYAVWTFDLGADFAAHPACRLAAYVPEPSAPSLVGGAPAHYFYYAAAYSAAAAPLGDFAVDQRENHGSWVSEVSFTAPGRTVSVRLVDAGVNQGSGSAGSRAAAAQIRLSCSAA